MTGKWWKTDIAADLQKGQQRGMKQPETPFVVEVTSDYEITCGAPKQTKQRIRMADVASVYVETSQSGPWSADVWWLLNNVTGQTQVAFPQGATGEGAALEGLRQLPGFEVRGMNSDENARFMCGLRSAP